MLPRYRIVALCIFGIKWPKSLCYEKTVQNVRQKVVPFGQCACADWMEHGFDQLESAANPRTRMPLGHTHIRYNTIGEFNVDSTWIHMYTSPQILPNFLLTSLYSEHRQLNLDEIYALWKLLFYLSVDPNIPTQRAIPPGSAVECQWKLEVNRHTTRWSCGFDQGPTDC